MNLGRSLTYYHAKFEPARLTFARELRGMTKRQLAEEIGYSPSRITQFESGKNIPTLDTFENIANTLNLHPSFFSAWTADIPQSSLGQTHFRSNIDVSQSERLRAHAYAQNVFRIYDYLEQQGVHFPKVSLGNYSQPASENDMEKLADRFREETGLGFGPIHDLPALLEGLGVRIILLEKRNVQLHGFASWIDGIPCMMIDAEADAGRLQFSYAHELKHLLFDEDYAPNDVLLERMANRFAGAFLMPAATFKEECPARYRQPEFQALKEHWHVSIAAALFRARQLGKMSEAAYRSATINRSGKGLRQKEEKDFTPAYPTLLAQAIDLVADDITLDDMQEALGIKANELFNILTTQKVNPDSLTKMVPAEKPARILEFKVTRKDR